MTEPCAASDAVLPFLLFSLPYATPQVGDESTWGAIAGLLKANWELVVGTGLAGTLIGAWVKHLLDERSARRAARRAFWQQVTDRIATLAKESYWALANHAAVVASELTDYTRERDLQLMFFPHDHQRLEKGLAQLVTDERVETAFFYFCRLIKHVDNFQFQESNTYLLRHHWAGRRAVQLYNEFISAVTNPTGSVSTGVDTFAILEALARGPDGDDQRRDGEGQQGSAAHSALPGDEAKKAQTGDAQPPARRASASGITLEEYLRVEETLKDPKDQFAAWLRDHPARVLTAAEALSAYSELLSQELADLYRAWFQPPGRWRRPDWRRSLIRSVAADRWPGVISESSFRTIDRASLQQPLLEAIGRRRSQARHLEDRRRAPKRASPGPATPPEAGGTSQQTAARAVDDLGSEAGR